LEFKAEDEKNEILGWFVVPLFDKGKLNTEIFTDIFLF
jgi:hypothetical protein